jgi:hypothetical protein
MANERKSREEDSREYQSRKDDIYKNLRMVDSGKLHIDPSEIPDGMDYRWVRYSVRGDTSFNNMGIMSRRGWTVVPSSRHPYLGNIDPLDVNATAMPYILVDGLILCERPAEFGEEERRIEAEHRLREMTANPAMTNMMSSPGMPVQVWANQTTNSRSFRNE